jgi:hypothetical protein
MVSGSKGGKKWGAPGTEDLAHNGKHRSPIDFLSFAAGHPPEEQQ